MPQDWNEVLLQLYARAPAPSRDYAGLTITKTEVILNIWNVTFGPHIYPKRQKCPLEDIEINKPLEMEISRLFGIHVLEYIKSMSKGELKLQNISNKLFLNILKHLAIRDVLNLSQTSKIFFERCGADFVWKALFKKFVKNPLEKRDLQIAEMFGWKETLKRKFIHQKPKSVKTTEKAVTNKNEIKRAGRSSSNKINSGKLPLITNKKTEKFDFPKSTTNLAISKHSAKVCNQIKSTVNLNSSKSLLHTQSDIKQSIKPKWNMPNTASSPPAVNIKLLTFDANTRILSDKKNSRIKK